MSDNNYNCPPRCLDCHVCHRGACDKPILISTCPFCHGSGITFHKQYGTERKCDECAGGVIYQTRS